MIKGYTEGSCRVYEPEITLSNIIGLLPAFGITRVANLTGLDRIGIPVAAAVRPNSKSLSVSQGKGISLAAAKVSAIMESIEAFHAENISLPTYYMSIEDFELKKKIADLNGLPRSFEKTISFTEKILWVEGTNLLDNTSRWLPYDSVTADFTTHEKPETAFIPDSNGLASGNTLKEAEIHAICEAIERDALVHFWVKDVEKRKELSVKIETIQHLSCASMLSTFTNADLTFKIWDITSDIGIPTFICKTVEKEFRPDRYIRPAFGSGTHPNKNVALSRAITEAAQSRVTFIAGSRDDQYKTVYSESLTLENHKRWHDELNHEDTIDYRSINSFEYNTFEDDMNLLFQQLELRGIKEVISVNLTKEEFNIPVVKVIIPYLETVSSSDIRAAGRRLLL